MASWTFFSQSTAVSTWEKLNKLRLIKIKIRNCFTLKCYKPSLALSALSKASLCTVTEIAFNLINDELLLAIACDSVST